MQTLQLGGSIVCYDDFKIESKPDLVAFLELENLNKFIESVQRDIILVLGGDGTMLEAIQKYHKKELPYLGVNFGSRGFLLNDKDNINGYLYTENQHPLFDAHITYSSHEIKKLGVIFNDVNLFPTSGCVLDFNVTINQGGESNYKGDGILISTPAGSTAHSTSYFSPILSHGTEKLILTTKGCGVKEGYKIIDGFPTIKIQNEGRLYDFGIKVDGEEPIYIPRNEQITLEINKSLESVILLVADGSQQN